MAAKEAKMSIKLERWIVFALDRENVPYALERSDKINNVRPSAVTMYEKNTIAPNTFPKLCSADADMVIDNCFSALVKVVLRRGLYIPTFFVSSLARFSTPACNKVHNPALMQDKQDCMCAGVRIEVSAKTRFSVF